MHDKTKELQRKLQLNHKIIVKNAHLSWVSKGIRKPKFCAFVPKFSLKKLLTKEKLPYQRLTRWNITILRTISELVMIKYRKSKWTKDWMKKYERPFQPKFHQSEWIDHSLLVLEFVWTMKDSFLWSMRTVVQKMQQTCGWDILPCIEVDWPNCCWSTSPQKKRETNKTFECDSFTQTNQNIHSKWKAIVEEINVFVLVFEKGEKRRPSCTLSACLTVWPQPRCINMTMSWYYIQHCKKFVLISLFFDQSRK